VDEVVYTTPSHTDPRNDTWERRPAPAFSSAAAMEVYRPVALFEQPATYEPGLPRELVDLRVIAQLHRTYILCEHPDGLFLIDQHNSHERWIYDQLKPADVIAQELLMPVVMTLSAPERGAAEEFQGRLAELGFTFEPFGPDTWVIRAIPALLPLREAEATVRELLSRGEAVGVVSRQAEDDPLRRTIACHSAVRAGDVLTVEQMEQIIARLRETKSPLTCPHGRPTGIMISLAELNRRCLRS
jgi:DNA mismatch repair protein MutL